MSDRQYLNLYEIISQAWFNKFTIILVLMTLKLFLFSRALVSDLGSIKAYTKSACASLDNYSQIMTSMPSYVSQVVNQVLASMMNSFFNQTLALLRILITICKSLIVFYIDVFWGTYACLLAAIISGSADFALDASQDVIKAANSTIVSACDTIEDALGGLSTLINKVLESWSKVKSLFGSDSKPDTSQYTKKVNLSIETLQKISIPSSILSDINDVKKKVPSFDELSNTSALVNIPFDKLSRSVNSSKMASNFSVKSLDTASDPSPKLCSHSLDIDKFYERLAQKIETTARIIILILSLLALFAAIFTITIEYYKWSKSFRIIDELKSMENHEDKESTVQLRNVLNKFHNRVIYSTDRFLKVPNKMKNNLYWMISYTTSNHALTIGMIGACGLLMVLLQFVLLNSVSGKISSLSNELKGFKTDVESLADNATETYVNQTNKDILSRQQSINDELFSGIKETSKSINSTISTFLESMNSTINSAFENTPFEKPVSTIVYCTIGKKLIKIEKGLTWITNNLSITLPSLPSDLNTKFSQATSKDFSKVADDITDGVQQVIATYKKALYIELYMSAAMFGIWVLQFFIGAIILTMRYYSRKENNSPYVIGSPRPLTEQQRIEYGYPHVDLQEKVFDNSSSVYSSDVDVQKKT
ncbi:Piso0_005611 [Millerozyma farinosa CBS 7064]|uniref:Plasma membrane fusion protein PRM1 n=1 Tax=Pichia sorbitophila (strain ATCC MYA-4447 / BCRC 22081 / CBS 7064 / NBRC 10061 / NRRL Y-12695) TaxID=559304 RepID=G8Y2F8_PICSO|nr:Piso0_005611 [Millerozyma farinosa CBS 7064]